MYNEIVSYAKYDKIVYKLYIIKLLSKIGK